MLSARSKTGLALAASSALALAAFGLAPLALAQGKPAAPAAQPAPPAAAVPAPAAAPAPQGPLAESVAAVVNDEVISSYDLVQRMQFLIVTAGIQPSEENLPQIQREALRGLVDERLQLQELRRVEKENKISIILSDKELDAYIADTAREQGMTADQFIGQLSATGVRPETFRAQLRAQLSWQEYIRGRFGSRLRIGADQVKAVQQRTADAASKPQYEISEIYIDAARVGGLEQAAQGAQQLIDQMHAGAPFPAVARQFSSAPSAASGGDAGWLGSGDLAPELVPALEALRPGQLSAPIPTQDGVYIIYLRDKRSGASATMVSLKQAGIQLAADATPAQVEAAQAKLEAIRPTVTGCADFEAKAKAQGVLAGDMGEADTTTLSPAFAEAATGEIGKVSAPIRSNVGVHLIMVCNRRQSGANVPTPEQVEQRLHGQQLALISRRVLRDLRNAATIETR